MVSTRQQCSGSSTTTVKVAVITKPEKIFGVVGLAQCSSSGQTNQVNILDLPYEVSEKILLYTNFKHISQLRSVSSIHWIPRLNNSVIIVCFLFVGFTAV